jgi:hypothetical protein
VATSSEYEAVRPTRKSLGDLGLTIPPINEPLHEIDDKHVREMQKMPERVLVGGAERILRITDHVWFKYKSSDVRAAVGKLKESEVVRSVQPIPELGRWWIGAAGRRQADSGQHDFYELLPTSSDDLLPNDWDEDRLEAEVTLRWTIRVRRVVRELITLSLQSGSPMAATVVDHYIRARVTDGDEVYLTLGTGGIYDPKVIAVILDSVPRVSIDDWFTEPSGTLGIEPQSGEVVWSTILPDETRQELLEG